MKIYRSVWGSLEYYDKRYDRISTKSEKKLTMINRLIHKITTTKDPVIRQVSEKIYCCFYFYSTKYYLLIRFVKHTEMFLLRMQ